PGGAGGLLHDVAQLARQDELAFAAHERRLDEHDVAAGRRVIHAGGLADLVFPGHLLRVDPGTAEEPAHVRLRDLLRRDLAGRDAPRDLAGEPPELALELPDAGLA